MNMHQKQELSLFAEELYRYMSPVTLNQLATEAGVKIQLEYDLLSREFSDVKIESGKRSDQAYSATRTGMAQKNELYIRDLGYFRLQDFKSI